MKSIRSTLVAFGLGAAGLLLVANSSAQTLRIANQGDILSLDPHSLNESLQLNVMANVYEPLVGRNKDQSLAPLLATSWRQISTTVWRFDLRKGVQFHDGTLLTPDDVIFSFIRATGESSNMKSNTLEIKEIRKAGDNAIEVETKFPFPTLPDSITEVLIMNRKWCEDNQATIPVDRRAGIENTASFRANGTGPFRVRERQPNVRTVFYRNVTYWGKIEGNAQEIVFTPIADAAARVNALLSADIDVVEPVPVADIPRINASVNARVIAGPELRTIFLGMDQRRNELLYSNVKGKNPFKDKRVRQAFYQAIDIVGMQRTIMRGASHPTALLVGPGINGWTQEQDKRLPFDPEASRKLLAEAGYANNFEVTLNCPSDRYVNDRQICEAVAANLGKVGVKVDLAIESKRTYFPKVLRRDTSFYLFGWTPSTYDAHDALGALTGCPDAAGSGLSNLGGYCNPKLDALVHIVRSESDRERRNALLKDALALQAEDIGTLPLHQQTLAWGVSKKVELTQMADDAMPFRWMSLRR
ncbi:MAG: ABC transporter substrate-binding protein [Janthinobacterium lividum]